MQVREYEMLYVGCIRLHENVDIAFLLELLTLKTEEDLSLAKFFAMPHKNLQLVFVTGVAKLALV